MSSDSIAIRIAELGKCYQIYARPQDRLKQSLFPRLRRLFGQAPSSYYHEFWALRDVSFDVHKGETVGIVGCNGSGKSTLLQIIAGTLTPTLGSVEVRGRVAALLELGAGFNPEFTGRENVYLNGGILGLTPQEVGERFAAIAAFADIGEFMEQPVKTYSSGMVVRLGFAVAINVDPEILIIDEALAVGDERFQRKCFSRIETIKSNGATILFVSHSGTAVVELCDQAVLLDGGERLAKGFPKQIVGRYQKLLYAPAEKRADIRQEIIDQDRALDAGQPDRLATASSRDSEPSHVMAEEVIESFDPELQPTSTISYEAHDVCIENPKILTLGGQRVNNLVMGRTYRYCYAVQFDRGATGVRFGMLIKTISGLELGGSASAASIAEAIPFIQGGSEYAVEFRFTCSLNPGVYFLNAGVVGLRDGSETYLHRLLDGAMFRVLPEHGSVSTGSVDFNCIPEFVLMSRARLSARVESDGSENR
jgi:lipopolysaccharide transport system ATP-binding protein